MQYLRARYYLPAQGIFNRLDPFFGNQDDPQSLHKYAYVHGDPVNGIDPSGMVTLMNLMFTMASKSMLISIPTLLGGVASKLLGGSFLQGIVAGGQLGVGLQLALLTGGPTGLLMAIGMGVLSVAIEYMILLAENLVDNFNPAYVASNSLEAFSDVQDFVWSLVVALSDGVFDYALESMASASQFGPFLLLLQIVVTAVRTLVQDDDLASGANATA